MYRDKFFIITRKLRICTEIGIPEKRLRIMFFTYKKYFYMRIPRATVLGKSPDFITRD